MMLVAVKYGHGMISGDIGNFFCTAPCAEKIWLVVGEQFGDKKGAIVVLKWALYGLKIASASFCEFLGDFLREMGFEPSKADQYLWIKKFKHYERYDYIATHVRDVMDSPEYYLGNSIAKRNGNVVISTKKYLKEVKR
eukprot:14172800-Ditylum_brightwellii.AAC.1